MQHKHTSRKAPAERESLGKPLKTGRIIFCNICWPDAGNDGDDHDDNGEGGDAVSLSNRRRFHARSRQNYSPNYAI
jgi:hypothetical protein